MELTVNIKDEKVDFFLELVESLDFVELDKEPTKEEILEGLKEAVEQVNLHKKGLLKLKTAQEVIDEL